MPETQEAAFILDEKAVNAIADKVAKKLMPKDPPPWDKTTERRLAERRKLNPRIKRVGGLISYEE